MQKKPVINFKYFYKGTNGPNDALPDASIRQFGKGLVAHITRSLAGKPSKEDEELKKDPSCREIPITEKQGKFIIDMLERENSVLSKTRKQLFDGYEEKWRAANEKSIKDKSSYEPLFTPTPYEQVLSIISRPGIIFACQYELTDLKILESLGEFLSCGNHLRLCINGLPFLRTKATRKALDTCYWYDMFESTRRSSIYVFEGESDFQINHQKWLLRRRNPNSELKQTSNSELLYGSANLTNNSKQSIESGFYFPDVSKLLSQQLVDDFTIISSLPGSMKWKDWKAKYKLG